ncbi:hypothetical protein LOK49_LG02G02077 [Camellia lanceoleosa]|uniref:Uncharacterized protein n=1 Tax=Camellia lanceoleosa TaxID=1840588 RepID=A0ACC0IT55_9ERIC|nr:hypothetical protein LOK49_LG02G02077 [Camellia lanceoleosa]
MTVKRELHDDDVETLPDMGLQFVSILSKPIRNSPWSSIEVCSRLHPILYQIAGVETESRSSISALGVLQLLSITT